MEKSHITSGHGGTLVKGAILLARLEYVEERAGPDARWRVLDAFTAEERRLLEARLVPSSFFPFELGTRLDEAIARLLDPGDPLSVYRELGRASIRAMLSATPVSPA